MVCLVQQNCIDLWFIGEALDNSSAEAAMESVYMEQAEESTSNEPQPDTKVQYDHITKSPPIISK